jgi:ethanolamine utilization protein EutQ
MDDRIPPRPHEPMKEKSTMPAASQGIRLFTAEDVDTWYRSGDRKIFLSDVLDPSNSESMSVGFARYAAGESNEWVVTYDEALIVTRGAYTVASADGVETTARAGEVIFLSKGTPVVYSAKEEGADVVYVTCPDWMDAQRQSEHAGFLETFHPVDGPPQRPNDAAFLDTFQPSEERPERGALVRSIYDPLERGEAGDSGGLFDALAEDAVLTTPVGEVRGKQAVIGYFANVAETLEYDIFVRPLEYYGNSKRVVQLGGETFRVKATGATHEADWAWVFDVEDGRVAQILAIMDLSGVADEVVEALDKAQKKGVSSGP